MFSDRVREIRDTCFGGNNVHFAKAIGAKEAGIRSWLTGKAVPGGTYLAKICVVAGVSPAWLLLGKGSLKGEIVATPELVIVGRVPHQLKQTVGLLRAVPILSDAAAAGSPRVVNEEDIDDYAVIFDRWHGKEQRALRIKGDSMAPTLFEDDIVGVDVSPNPKVRKIDGRIVAARFDDGVVVKRLAVADNHQLVLVSDNKEHAPFVMDQERDAIIGPVIWAWHQFA